MHAESKYIGPYTGDGHQGSCLECDIRDTVGKSITVGGVVIFGGGFAKRGVRPNPPNPPGYGPVSVSYLTVSWVNCCKIKKHVGLMFDPDKQFTLTTIVTIIRCPVAKVCCDCETVASPILVKKSLILHFPHFSRIVSTFMQRLCLFSLSF